MISAAVVGRDTALALEDEIAKLRRRDPDALLALVQRYQHRLYRYLCRLVHDRAVAEDLFQQTWLRVVESIRQFDARRNFDTWLFAVAHNLAIDHLRRKHPESLDEAHEGVACAAEPNALDRLLAWERAEVLLAKLAELPAIHRAVLTLRFEEDMKLEEIAQLLRVPLATVKSRLHRALESLRRKLEAGP